MSATEPQKQFLITEYVQLRSELMFCIQGIERVERYAIIISGAIWAWLATQTWDPAFFIVLFMPAMITKLFEIKRHSLSEAIKQIASYIYKIEDTVDVTSEEIGKLGWEHRERVSTFRNWSKIYWKLLFWGNIGIALIYLITRLVFQYKLF